MRIIRNILAGAIFIYLYQAFELTTLLSFRALWTYALADSIACVILCIVPAFVAVVTNYNWGYV